VHGDLSAYNILYWEGQISLIDFPQAIDPEANRNAYRIFARDVARICEYFTRQGVSTNAGRLASDLWTAYGYPLQPEVDPRLLKDEDEAETR
jgi:RIO kinase 1